MLFSSSDDESISSLMQLQRAQSPNADLKRELMSYRAKKRINVADSPLGWWRDNKTEFKKLSSIARRYLSVPPASVPSEQLFSGAGLVYDTLRNRLDPKKAAILLFIKYNAPTFQFNY